MANKRFRRITDLFVVGKPVPLADGTYLWVQALNAYQRDECVSDAQVARARLVMALRETGDERTKIEARFYETGRDTAITELADLKMRAKISEVLEDLRSDPDWKERLEILLRTDTSDTAEPMTPEEMRLLATINDDVMAEMHKREADEAAYQTEQLSRLTDEELIEEWLEQWVESRGTSLAAAEYRLTETWYATRYCNALPVPDGELDHTECDGHTERIFESRTDVREVPETLLSLVQDALMEINVGGTDPKGSARRPSSSGSSPTPNAPAASTPSTSDETQPEAPGTSPSQSPTPSTSSPGTNSPTMNDLPSSSGSTTTPSTSTGTQSHNAA
jgi:hypothetical protein